MVEHCAVADPVAGCDVISGAGGPTVGAVEIQHDPDPVQMQWSEDPVRQLGDHHGGGHPGQRDTIAHQRTVPRVAARTRLPAPGAGAGEDTSHSGSLNRRRRQLTRQPLLGGRSGGRRRSCLIQPVGGVAQARQDVVKDKLRVVGDDLGRQLAFGQESEDGDDRV